MFLTMRKEAFKFPSKTTRVGVGGFNSTSLTFGSFLMSSFVPARVVTVKSPVRLFKGSRPAEIWFFKTWTVNFWNRKTKNIYFTQTTDKKQIAAVCDLHVAIIILNCFALLFCNRQPYKMKETADYGLCLLNPYMSSSSYSNIIRSKKLMIHHLGNNCTVNRYKDSETVWRFLESFI